VSEAAVEVVVEADAKALELREKNSTWYEAPDKRHWRRVRRLDKD